MGGYDPGWYILQVLEACGIIRGTDNANSTKEGQNMAPRKAIYTPEEAKARKIANTSQWQKENTVVTNIRTTPEDKAIYEAYAQYKGLALSRMFRQCAEVCMRLDGWTYQPKAGTEDQPGADQQTGQE